jgi:hypothetical protein
MQRNRVHCSSMMSKASSLRDGPVTAKKLWISQRNPLTLSRISYIMLTRKSVTILLPQTTPNKPFDKQEHSALSQVLSRHVGAQPTCVRQACCVPSAQACAS